MVVVLAQVVRQRQAGRRTFHDGHPEAQALVVDDAALAARVDVVRQGCPLVDSARPVPFVVPGLDRWHRRSAAKS